MMKAGCRVLTGAIIFFGLADLTLAAPSPSCAAKFVGSWQVTVLATGQTYPAVISPNGTTHVTCPLCNPTGTWTCNGNTITILAPTPTSHTISADGRTMSGGCCTAVRIGGAPAAAKPAQETPPQPRKEATAKTGGQRQSCSDISGIGGAPLDCPEPKKRQVDQPKQAAASKQEAYGPPRPADDAAVALIGKILDESRKLPPPQLPASPAPAPSPNSTPNSQIEPAQRAKLIQEAQSYLLAARAAEMNDRSCAGWRKAAQNYQDAGELVHRAGLAERATEILSIAKRLDAAVDKAESENKCTQQQAKVTTPPSGAGKETGTSEEKCKGPIDQLRRVADLQSRMGSIGPKAPVTGSSTDLSIMKVELAARGCRDPQNPLTVNDCLRASVHWMDIIAPEESRRRLEAAGCSNL
jgi:hypothetical protein